MRQEPAVLNPVRPDVSNDCEDDGAGAGGVEAQGEPVAAEAAAVEAAGDAATDPGDGEEAEEAREARPARNPLAPTRAEREAHEATHLPFRTWCAACVAGRRDNPPHRRMPEEEHQVPEVMMDYAFVRRADEAETATILLLKDRESRSMRAWVMRYKGGQHRGGRVKSRRGHISVWA